MSQSKDLILFTMAASSGMGRFASEMVRAAGRVWPGEVSLIAPSMEHEPGLPKRVVFPGPLNNASKIRRLWRLASMNFTAAGLVWRHATRNQVFLMIDLSTTVPLSVLPAIAARLRGATTVLNIHDFYPHALRYHAKLKWFELACYRFSYRRFDQIAVMQPVQIKRLEAEAGVSSDKVVRIEHGNFPVEGITPPTDDAPLTLLIMGSLRENKRVLESIEAIRLLRAQGKNVRLRIAGAPRREELNYWIKCKKSLDALSREWPDAIELNARYINNDELSGFLSGIDAMLCPYEGFDSQSGVSVMAVSSGLPLLATRAAFVTGCDPCGEIPLPVSAESIANAIDMLSQQPRAIRLAQGQAMRTRFENRSLWDDAIRIIANGIGIKVEK